MRDRKFNEIVIKGDRVELNGIGKTKNELKTEMLRRLDSTTELPAEMENKLLSPVAAAIN